MEKKWTQVLLAAVVMVGVGVAEGTSIIELLGPDEWVHLGDQNLPEMISYGGAAPSGVTWMEQFSLSNLPAVVTLGVDIYGSDYDNYIYINSTLAGQLPKDAGFLGGQEVTLEPSAFQVGLNAIEIKAELRGGNYDDVGFGNMFLTVPEPATVSFVLMGGVALLRR